MPKDKIQQSFIQQQLHNETVKDNIQTIYQLAENHSSQELIQMLHQWSKTPPVLTVTNTLFWTLIGAAIGVGVLCLLIGLPLWAFILPIGILVFAFIKKENNKARNELFGFLRSKVLQDKYELQFNTVLPNYTLNNLQQMFTLFGRGNHENYISDSVSGFMNIAENEYPFTLYQYHYVNERSHRDQDGNIKYSYDHYDRWGIFISNIPYHGISISNDQTKACQLGIKWTTSDIQFNKKFKMSGNNEIDLAKFFNPARVMLLDQILAKDRVDLILHPTHPVLCWQFEQNIFRVQPKQPAIHTIHQLAEFLQKLEMPEWEALRQKLTPLLEKMN